MFKPILDRVLLRKIEEKQDGKVIIPDQFHESSKYEIVALGDFAMFGGVRVPLSDIVEVGERVLVGHYNIEPCEIDGEKLFLTRVQDIRGREHVALKSRAAA